MEGNEDWVFFEAVAVGTEGTRDEFCLLLLTDASGSPSRVRFLLTEMVPEGSLKNKRSPRKWC
jgi:hypothetical protein